MGIRNFRLRSFLFASVGSPFPACNAAGFVAKPSDKDLISGSSPRMPVPLHWTMRIARSGGSARTSIHAFLSILALTLACALFPHTVSAQIPQPSDTTSVPIPGAGHDYLEGPIETVSPANGSISIRLPVIIPPSRGVTLPFSFMYDSNLYYLFGNSSGGAQWSRVGSSGPFSSAGPFSSSGWSFGEPFVSATVARWVEIDPILGTKINCVYTYGYVFQDAAGGRHNLNLTNFYNDPNHDCQGDPSVTAPSGFEGQVFAQGSEGPIMGSIPATWTSPNQQGAASPTVTDGDGTVYNFSGTLPGCKAPCSSPFYSRLTSITDRNGNTITVTNPVYPSSVTSYTDTSGRTALQDSGFAISPETVTVSGLGAAYTVNWANQPSPTFASSIQIQCLSGTCGPPASPYGNAPAVSSIVLPNGKSYAFAYDTTYGLVNKITYPTGGYARYVWGQNPLSHYGEFTIQQPLSVFQMYYSIPAITDRYVSFDGSTEVLHQTFSYSTAWSPSDPSTWTSKTTTVTTTDSVRNTTFTTFYTYEPIPLPAVPGAPSNDQDPHPANPVEKTVVYNGTDGSLLKTVSKTWANERLLTSQETAYPNGQASGTFWSYDANEMQIERDDYDFGTAWPPPAANLLRATATTYATLGTNHIVDKPSSVTIYSDAAKTNRVAETDYGYDTPAATTLSGIVQHSGGCKCGNLTSSSKWVNNSGSTLTSTFINDDTGQRLSMTDPRGNITSYSYTDNYSSGTPPGPTNTYLTKVTSSLNHIEKYAYAYASGDVTSSTDQNNLVTTYKYVDNLGRLTETDLPDGGKTTIAYNDAAYNPSTPSPSVTTTKAINATTSAVAISARDGLGHVARTLLSSDPQGTVYTDTVYDGLARAKSVSNPYRSGTDATTTLGTTSFTYDALGRKISETAPDGSVTTTAYCAGYTLVTDATNKWRRSRADGLGRLVEVDEPNAPGVTVGASGCPGTGEHIWVTSYSIDTTGNLTQVVQNGSHQRTFSYDFISRLTISTNPESGTIHYNYDSDTNCSGLNSFPGLLVSKVDARGIRTCAQYDALNRETSLSYSNGDTSITTTYDQSSCLGLSTCQNVGHRTSVTDAAGSESWAYDVDQTNLRSIHQEQRTTNSSPHNVTKTTTYYLDLARNLTQLVYPTGRTVNYTYDAANRPSTAADAANGITYASDWKTPPAGTNCTASAVCYTPQGSVYGMSIGQTSSFTGFNISETFNNRLQPNEIKASSSAGTAIDITYNFVDPASGRNGGHVNAITNNLNSGRTQTFTYDQLNRIYTAGTTSTTGGYCWGYQYSYDAWGNLLGQAGLSPIYNACTESVMGTVTADSGNHISGLSYDGSGNTLSDGVYSYTYNGESQMKTANGVTYAYDGDGRRAAKVGSKLYWYGSGGEILAETDAAGNTLNEYVFFSGKRVALVPALGSALYYAEDLLGSSRVIAQSNGTLCYDADFTPFGGERSYTSTCAQNYKFEGKERDSETQNDDFGAREYTWRFGRWLSADWSSVPVPVPYANLSNPQTLNLYAMVADDPESFADLDGHDTCNGVNNNCFPPNTHTVFDNMNLATPPQDVAAKQKQGAQTAASVAQNQPLTSVTVLGNKVGITYGAKLSAADQLAASNAIGAAAGLINKNASSLTADQTKAIGQISSFAVSGPNTLLGATGKGSMTLSIGYIHDSSAAWLGSLFGHEGQHYLNSGKYSGANLWRDEQSAGRTQLGIGNKIGFSDAERGHLEQWIDDRNRAAMQQHMEQGYSQ
jgi:RHS repeat-associated protein